ncbi:MAG: two-component system, OmpR family, response regulator MprA [Micromonosporaceae bacterium]|nr:two-component system, OmpR family, response regulator MprA [Micromonosporaceae bacterium]
MRVLVVDDEPGVRESVSGALRFAGYEVSVAENGIAALELVRLDQPDAIVLDMSMPRMDGLETCRTLRAEGHRLPVLMLSARDGEPDRVAGLRAGADDYLVKPFGLPELLDRLGMLIRRPPVDGLGLRPAGRVLIRDSAEVALSPTEYRIATAFLDHPTQSLSRAALFEHVWGYDFGGGSPILDPYLTSLDRKLAQLGCRLLSTPDGYLLTRPAPAN